MCDEGFDSNGSTEYCGLEYQLKKDNPSASEDDIEDYMYEVEHRCNEISESFVLVHEAEPDGTPSLTIGQDSYYEGELPLEQMLVDNGHALSTIHEIDDDDLVELCDDIAYGSIENVTSPPGVGYRVLYLSHED